MKKQNIFTMCLIAISFSSFFATPAKAVTSSIMIDAESKNVISSNRADLKRYPASMTKLMTLYMTFTALDMGLFRMEDELPVSQKAWNVSPSKLGVEVGGKITVHDAILALIVKSANDCAVVLAEAIGHDEQSFAVAMTDVAKELGMKNTVFKNASGLPNKEHKSTAEDMAILALAMYKHYPQYYDLFSTTEFRYNNIRYTNTNHLLQTFEGADGLKTGYTRAAGYNIVTSAEREGKRVIAVTMGHRTFDGRDKQIAKMMNSGLNKLIKVDSKSEVQVAKTEIVKENNKTAKKEEVLPKIVVAEIEPLIVEEDNLSSWAVHIGSFTNYTKARNYAKDITKKQPKLFANKNIEIEISESHSAIIYLSKIAAFSKEDANNLCNDLKKITNSCNVIEATNLNLALHH